MADEPTLGPITDSPPIEPKPDFRASQDAPTARLRRSLGSGKGREPREPRKPREPVAKQRPGFFVKPIEQMYGMLAMAAMMKAPNTAAVIMKQAHDCAVAWDQLAQKNEAIRRMLMAITQTSDWGLIVVAHMPILFTAMNESGVQSPILDMFGTSIADEAEEHLKRNPE